MKNEVERGKRKNGTEYKYVSFVCGNYARSGKTACTVHTIYENALTNLVLEEIRAIAKAVDYDKDNIINKIIKAKNKEIYDRENFYKKRLQSNAKRLTQLEMIIEELYTDRREKNISEEAFARLMKKYDSELQSKSLDTLEITNIIESYKKDVCSVSTWAGIIKKYVELENLEQEILLELIDKIEIGEAIKMHGKRICNIKIIYRIVGDISNLKSEVFADENPKNKAV